MRNYPHVYPDTLPFARRSDSEVDTTVGTLGSTSPGKRIGIPSGRGVHRFFPYWGIICYEVSYSKALLAMLSWRDTNVSSPLLTVNRLIHPIFRQ
jgi:hypothetical protein